MKNLKIGVKLVGGFTLTAIIVLAVGLMAMRQLEKLHHQEELLGDENIPAVESILIIKSEAASIASLMRTLLSPYVSVEQRKQSHEGLLASRKVYGAAKKKFLELQIKSEVEQEWKDFGVHIGKWVKANNTAVDLSKNLITMDLTNPAELNMHMKDFELAHQSLLNNTNKMLLFGTPFNGGTDHTSCSLGKWLGNMSTTNPEIVTLANQLRPIHAKLHATVATIKGKVENSENYSAKSLAEADLYPLSEQVFALTDQMTAIANAASDAFMQMNRLLLEEGATHQKNTFAEIDKIVNLAVESADASIKEGEMINKKSRLLTIIGIAAGIALALGLGLTLTALITRPLSKGVTLAQAMADGDLTKSMDVDQKDEIGVLANALNDMTTNLRSMFTDISEGVGNVDDSSNQLAAIADQMSSGSQDTAGRANQVAAAAEEMSANQDSVAAAMEEASVNVNMVSAAAEEMNSTIGEIAQNSSKAKEITTQAVDQSQKASERVDELGKAANEINKVTEAITEISEQTNLLALNATIEAARAGEAGKGFAVVANEIKDLAKQTAEATEEIKNKIQGIQQATGITVKEINEISTVIADVDHIVATIASAVEEQSVTTKEIAENVNQASLGISEVNENVAQSSTVSAEIAADIAEVNTSANEMSTASNQVKDRAEELSSVSETLKEMVERFKI